MGTRALSVGISDPKTYNQTGRSTHCDQRSEINEYLFLLLVVAVINSLKWLIYAIDNTVPADMLVSAFISDKWQKC